jgi:3-phenylpropionate/cinnamic acid dioxygenase small subunit
MSDDLRKVLDEMEIRNLIGRLAQLADTGDLDEYASLFTEDAHWELKAKPGDKAPFAPIRGRANILAGAHARRATGGQGPGSHTRHVLGSTVVKLDGDSALATSNLIFYKNTDTKPEIAVMTFYNDQFKRTPHGWKLASRIMTMG